MRRGGDGGDGGEERWESLGPTYGRMTCAFLLFERLDAWEDPLFISA